MQATAETSTIRETADGFFVGDQQFDKYREAMRFASDLLGNKNGRRWNGPKFVALDGTEGVMLSDGSIAMDGDATNRDRYGVPIGDDGSYTCEICGGEGEYRSFRTKEISKCSCKNGRRGVR